MVCSFMADRQFFANSVFCQGTTTVGQHKQPIVPNWFYWHMKGGYRRSGPRPGVWPLPRPQHSSLSSAGRTLQKHTWIPLKNDGRIKPMYRLLIKSYSHKRLTKIKNRFGVGATGRRFLRGFVDSPSSDENFICKNDENVLCLNSNQFCHCRKL